MRKLKFLVCQIAAVGSLCGCFNQSAVLLEPENNAVVNQHNYLQQEIVRRNLSRKELAEFIKSERDLQKIRDFSFPESIDFRWSAAAADSLQISTDPDFSRVLRTVPVAAGQQEMQLHSLPSDTVFYWKLLDKDGKDLSGVNIFSTADELPRSIRIDGISNVRDLGGWPTIDGKRVRQGLLYRGGEFNGHMTLTEEGRVFLEKELGIRTDLDLRGESEFGPLGGGQVLAAPVKWINIPVGAYQLIMDPGQPESYVRIFRLAADPDNLPLYMHCFGGADRTGTVVLMLNALLGVSAENLLRDYEWTSLAIWGDRNRDKAELQQFFKILSQYAPSGTLQQQVEAFFKHYGVTDKEINDFRQLFLE